MPVHNRATCGYNDVMMTMKQIDSLVGQSIKWYIGWPWVLLFFIMDYLNDRELCTTMFPVGLILGLTCMAYSIIAASLPVIIIGEMFRMCFS